MELPCCQNKEIEISGTGFHGWCKNCGSLIILPQGIEQGFAQWIESKKENPVIADQYRQEIISQPQTSLFDFL